MEKRNKIYDYIGNLCKLAIKGGAVLENHNYSLYGEEQKTSADLSKITFLGNERDADEQER